MLLVTMTNANEIISEDDDHVNLAFIYYSKQVPAAMDGVPAPISMLVDPSTNPEAIALVCLSFSLKSSHLDSEVVLIFTQII